MRIRLWLCLLSLVAIAVVQPAAHASSSRGAPSKKIAAPRAPLKTRLLRRPKVDKNALKRKVTEQDQIAAPRTARTAKVTSSRPSVAGNVGWGAFFATLGTASAIQGGILGALIGAGAAAFNGVKAWLIGRRGATVAQAHSIAYNAGWGTFWGGVGVHGLATGNPLAAAIGLGAGAYNLFKAGRNTRALSRTGE